MSRDEGNSMLVDDLEHQIRRFLALDDGLPLVLSLWCLATYVYDCFDAFPYLGITSPTKRCGKTRATEVLELFCARPLRTVGMTTAVLFRSIEQDKPTLMVDEAEGLRGPDDHSSALRQILNAGYRVGQKVRRCEQNKSKSIELREFETYCPKVLVLIGKLPDTLDDRTIPIRMRRKHSGEGVDRFIQSHAKRDTAHLRESCEQWAAEYREYVRAHYESVGDLAFLADREAELWVPLFVICDIAAPHRRDCLEMVARRIAGAKAQDEPGDAGIGLLTDLRNIYDDDKRERVSTADLLQALNGIQDGPWNDFCQGRPLQARALGRLLSPFGVRPQNLRFGSGVVKGYTLDSLKDAFARYLR